MSTERLYRPLGLAAHLGWARLLANRHRDLVEPPSPAREGARALLAATTSPPAVDGEGAFRYGNSRSPDHTH